MLYSPHLAKTSLTKTGESFISLVYWCTRVKSELEQPAWVETWARRIQALNLSPVVLSLIEIARPFGFLGSQVLVAAQPLMTGIADDEQLGQILALLDNPETWEWLKTCLEEGEART